MDPIAALCLFMRTSPVDFALLGGTSKSNPSIGLLQVWVDYCKEENKKANKFWLNNKITNILLKNTGFRHPIKEQPSNQTA
jgi:hypothetical protein